VTRQIVLDTETTGLEVEAGHRVIEIGCVELRGRRPTGNTFHQYLNPEREIDAGASRVHGLTREFLAERPRFVEIAGALLDFLRDAELIIHNAAFDAGFLDRELELAGFSERIGAVCRVTDTLQLARQLYPGQRASLDALCKRHHIDNSHRNLHGAMLDAQLLAEVYLAMTGGQAALGLDVAGARARPDLAVLSASADAGGALTVVRASDEEWIAHRERLAAIELKSRGCLWQADFPAPPDHGQVASAVTTSK
jgi:DNA polymerase-3 subunit epsilon